MNTMLILRGNPGNWPNEEGKVVNYPRGALHQGAALEYAKLKRYAGKVLDVAGWAGENSAQTVMALAEFRRDLTVAAVFGDSRTKLRSPIPPGGPSRVLMGTPPTRSRL